MIRCGERRPPRLSSRSRSWSRRRAPPCRGARGARMKALPYRGEDLHAVERERLDPRLGELRLRELVCRRLSAAARYASATTPAGAPGTTRRNPVASSSLRARYGTATHQRAATAGCRAGGGHDRLALRRQQPAAGSASPSSPACRSWARRARRAVRPRPPLRRPGSDRSRVDADRPASGVARQISSRHRSFAPGPRVGGDRFGIRSHSMRRTYRGRPSRPGHPARPDRSAGSARATPSSPRHHRLDHANIVRCGELIAWRDVEHEPAALQVRRHPSRLGRPVAHERREVTSRPERVPAERVQGNAAEPEREHDDRDRRPGFRGARSVPPRTARRRRERTPSHPRHDRP